MTSLTAQQVQRYREAGYLCPNAGLAPAEAAACRDRLLALADGSGQIGPTHRQNPHLWLLWAADLARDPRILDAVEALIGRDIVVWRSSLFVKPGRDPAFVAWHQDAAYWGFDGDDVVTAWVALTDSDERNGCVRVVPGSHRDVKPHVVDKDRANLLIRGQRVAADVRLEDTAPLALRAGEFSLHHVGIIHGSTPNESDGVRAGLALRFVATRVRPRTPGERASLVRGEDRHGHFALDPLPTRDGDLDAQRRHLRSLRGYAGQVLREILTKPTRGGLVLAARLAVRPGTWRAAFRLVTGRHSAGDA